VIWIVDASLIEIRWKIVQDDDDGNKYVKRFETSILKYYQKAYA
jgi:hypothetical protein